MMRLTKKEHPKSLHKKDAPKSTLKEPPFPLIKWNRGPFHKEINVY